MMNFIKRIINHRKERRAYFIFYCEVVTIVDYLKWYIEVYNCSDLYDVIKDLEKSLADMEKALK